jgi:hypothetical protein
LYLSEETTIQMWWHKEGKHDSKDLNIMSHPANSEAWEALDRFDPELARNSRSVRLDLSTDSRRLRWRRRLRGWWRLMWSRRLLKRRRRRMMVSGRRVHRGGGG